LLVTVLKPGVSSVTLAPWQCPTSDNVAPTLPNSELRIQEAVV